ncbi:MAG TPA: U-box domain-containing protein [Gammaproteobacteria bacterium]|jgi:hypothetical protein|nr:U-box domain-containing protein [Gammaproteobacteria bacterium]
MIRNFLFSNSYKEAAGLKLKWKTIVEEIPEEFQDPITFDLINDPIFTTEYAHIFDKNTLDNISKSQVEFLCPLTRANLKESVLNTEEKKIIVAPNIKMIIKKYLDSQKKLLKEISKVNSYALNNELKEENLNTQPIKNKMDKKIEEHDQKTKEYIQEYKDACFALTAQQIQHIKNRLMLDITEKRHLQWWHEHYPRCCDLGLVTVKHKTNTFKISAKVYEVLLIANKSYKRVSEFYAAIESTKKNPKVGMINRFFGNTVKSRMLLDVSNDFRTLDLSWALLSNTHFS